MIRVYPAETDEQLEAWRRVRIAVLPTERTASVEEIRRTAPPERLLLLAELDGEVVASGFADRADVTGFGVVAPRVVESARRRGVGTVLLRALADHVQSLGFEETRAHVDDPGSLAFAQRFGFREIDRQVEQIRVVLEDEPEPALPDGVEVVRVADRPELWRAAYDTVAAQAFVDMPLEHPVEATLEVWENEWLTWPEATFLAVAAGEVIGCAGLQPDPDFPERAEHALTAVRRDWRRRGVATGLKQATLAFAAANGIREVYTWTQRGNGDMRRLNQRLGYITRTESLTLLGVLPLPDEGAAA